MWLKGEWDEQIACDIYTTADHLVYIENSSITLYLYKSHDCWNLFCKNMKQKIAQKEAATTWPVCSNNMITPIGSNHTMVTSNYLSL